MPPEAIGFLLNRLFEQDNPLNPLIVNDFKHEGGAELCKGFWEG